MSLLCNKSEYIKRMNSAIKDKSVLLNYIVGEKVLDFGCGSGILSSLIAEKFPNKEVYGFDESVEMIKEAQMYGNDNVIFTSSLNIYALTFDTIILCSVLHEVYSYGEEEKSVYDLFKKLNEMLKPGGRIIVRDGFLTNGNSKISSTFIDQEDGFNFFKNYERGYKWEKPELRIGSDGYKVIGTLDTVKEFLNKYTWGWNSLPREVHEKINFFSQNDFRKLGDSFGYRTNVSYVLQKEYFEYLKQKVNLNKEIWDTTIIVIYDKEFIV